jgi:hypothetical protein
VPGVEKVIAFEVAPAEIPWVSNTPPLDVAVCVVPSWFTQTTDIPTGTFVGLGEYAVVVRLKAPETIDTDEPLAGGPPGGGFGDGAGAGDELPHAVITSAIPMIELTRTNMMVGSFMKPAHRKRVAGRVRGIREHFALGDRQAFSRTQIVFANRNLQSSCRRV